MGKLKRREKIIAVFASFAVLGSVWFYLVWLPLESYEKHLDAELTARSLELYEDKRYLTQAAQNKFVRDSLNKFYSSGSTQEDLSQLIKEIENTATGAGLKVIEKRPEPSSKNAEWHELKVFIAFEGAWEDIVRFLYLMDNSSRPLLVRDMSLEAALPQQMTVRGRLEIVRLLISPSGAGP